MISRLQHVSEDLQRIHRKCRNIAIDGHEELLKILHELHTTMKTYHSYRTMEQQAAAKLSVVESNRVKLEQGLPKDKVEKSRRYRLICKEWQKRSDKHDEARLKALKARNEYVLCTEAANAAVQKYFVDDLSELVDATDFGFHTCFSRCLLMYNSTLACLQRSLVGSQEGMRKCLESLDARADKQKFLEYNNAAFMAPKKFMFQAHKSDVGVVLNNAMAKDTGRVQVQVEDAIYEDMEQRFRQLQKRLSDLKIENEEVWKTLETAEKTLMEMIESRDFDVSPHFDSDADQPLVTTLNSAVPSAVGAHSLSVDLMKGPTSPLNGNLIPRPPETVAIKLRADKQETEDFYLDKFREYSMQCSVISRLQARADCMEQALSRSGPGTTAGNVERTKNNSAVFATKRTRRKRIGRQAVTGEPRLFGGSVEEYVDATGHEIPLVVRSCVRVINLFGLHHQGVFRVSGSQLEINAMREAFERGEDPLADISDASDINSIAGLLKLYLRELREPLFPIFYFDQLMEISQLSSELSSRKKEFIAKTKDVARNLPRAVFIVLRYLFAFLNHLSEFSDENMMDPYNLAICFGPSLLPIPEDKNPVQYQPLVNELIKGLIVYQEEIFPDSEGGPLYEKYISSDQPPFEDLDLDVPPSEESQNITTLLTDEEAEVHGPADADDLVNEPEISIHLFGKEEVLEAVAQYDFAARHERELSFCRGDVLHLYIQLSADWWKGSFRGREGLIPDKYIMLNIRDVDRDKMSQERRMSSTSSESLSSTGVSVSPQRQASESLHPSPNRNHSPPPLSLTDPRGRRRSLSPTSLGGLKLHQYQTQMASLKWKLRPSTSVNDALETSTASSSSLENVSALTGAVSRLRRQSPMYARHSPILQRRPQHIDSGSSSDLARDLSEALHSISTLSIEHGNHSEKPPSPPHSAGLAAPPTVSLLASSPLSGPPSLPSLVGASTTLTGTAPPCLGAAESVMGVSIKKGAPDLVQDLPLTSAGTCKGGSSSTEDSEGSPSPQPPSSGAFPGEPTTGVQMRDSASSIPAGAQCKKSSLQLSSSSSSSDPHGHSSHHLTTAERFALTNQCTMRKGSPRPSPRTEHGVAAVSPAPPAPAPLAPLPPGHSGVVASIAGGGQSRRSSCGTLSPMVSSVPASIQKLKRMFTEPEKPDNRVMVTPPPLSPKPPVKAKPTGLLNRQRLSPHLAASGSSPRESPPDSPSAIQMSTGSQLDKTVGCSNSSLPTPGGQATRGGESGSRNEGGTTETASGSDETKGCGSGPSTQQPPRPTVQE
ncbi:SLIT-ROBO Rho GTPase-activating protein 1-like isoform X4 [Varroa destructor]|nr:SLIT-ROBO Rho GTPase-activating protein 1-like isoform X4 [Varroa destructor]